MTKKKGLTSENFLLQGSILAAASIVVRLIGLVYRIPLTGILGDEGNGIYAAAFGRHSHGLFGADFRTGQPLPRTDEGAGLGDAGKDLRERGD